MDNDETYPLRLPTPIPEPGYPLRDSSLTPATRRRPSPLGKIILWDLTIALCLLHGWGIWLGMGGREGLTNGWPLWRDDHPLYFHSALATRSFLKQTGTTAGYDPTFMSGFAKSVIFPASSTLPEIVVAVAGGDHPEFAYKLYVLIAAAAVPWIVLLAARGWGATAGGCLLAVALDLIYIWTDFPIRYATFGMLPYLLGIPLSLVATAKIATYLDRGGSFRWLVAALASSLCVLVHVTTAMLVVPAAVAIYIVSIVRARATGNRLSISRHLGYWFLPLIVLGLNAFWWLPGVYLTATRGVSDFAFAHSAESLTERLAQIFVTEPLIEGILWGMGILGLALTWRKIPVRGMGLIAFAVAGFFWGYLAGAFPSLDFLQPGRHTYGLYTSLAVASGIGWAEICRRLNAPGDGRFGVAIWANLALLIVGARVLLPTIDISVTTQLGRSSPMLNQVLARDRRIATGPGRAEPFLSSRPSPRLIWVIDQIREYAKPGERVLYEEGGFAVPGEPDPFDGGRFSGLLPWKCGVEVIGGPYLHASVTTNFTQFGEGKLFGDAAWDQAWFVEHAKLYRPSAIVCWTNRARSFCKAHPELVEIRADDGRVLVGRIKGFEGAAIRGEANVEASPNRLKVTAIKPGVDGLAVLRYHSVPRLRSMPEGRWEPVSIEGDPVPFIGVRPSTEPIELELSLPIRMIGGQPKSTD